MRWSKKALKSAEILSLALLAGLLAAGSVFALRCHSEERQMFNLLGLSQHRERACLELGWRWEADDQQHQYHSGSSAGTSATVGPIAGFVMDVTENEFGHAEGQCHAVNAAYHDLFAGY